MARRLSHQPATPPPEYLPQQLVYRLEGYSMPAVLDAAGPPEDPPPQPGGCACSPSSVRLLYLLALVLDVLVLILAAFLLVPPTPLLCAGRACDAVAATGLAAGGCTLLTCLARLMLALRSANPRGSALCFLPAAALWAAMVIITPVVFDWPFDAASVPCLLLLISAVLLALCLAVLVADCCCARGCCAGNDPPSGPPSPPPPPAPFFQLQHFLDPRLAVDNTGDKTYHQ